MSVSLLTGNAAAAWAARLADVDYLPVYPITPQTEIIETLGGWVAAGALPARMVTLDSEHSMITAAGAAAATGVRVFTATSSQGLLYAMEMLYAVAGWRVPFVLVNVSRGLASPITLEPDHDDILAARDSGCLQLHCATCQEVLDLVLIAFRLGEDPRVRLPVIVNMDGFYLSFTREPVAVPEWEGVRRFLPAFEPGDMAFRAQNPLSAGVAVLSGAAYSYFRYEMHLAAKRALTVFAEAAREYGDIVGRSYAPIESYRLDDAAIAFVMMGSFSTKARDAVDRLRDAGKAIGLLQLRLLRPFPEDDVRRALRHKRGVAVVDQNLSLGKGGVLHAELASVLYGVPDAPCALVSFVAGLGGRDIAAEEFFEMAAVTERAASAGETPPPRLLYTEEELRQLRALQAVAVRRAADEAEGHE